MQYLVKMAVTIFKSSKAQFYLVASPIGNLGDFSSRAKDVLTSCDTIFCEDTRVTAKLLAHFNIAKKLFSARSQNEENQINHLLELLTEGKTVCYLSDSGTPGISDPGAVLFRAARDAGFEASMIPGASALICAVILSHLRCDRFFFGGFLPASPKNRRRMLREFANFPFSLVFYESPHRLNKTLADIKLVLGNRNCAAVKEITKIHEQTICGGVDELMEFFAKETPRGEFVLVVEGFSQAIDENFEEEN